MSGVDSSNVLECLRQIIDEHHLRVQMAGPAATVPVLLTERARFSRTLREITRAEGGAYVDATSCGVGIKVTADPRSAVPALVSGVEQVLDELNRLEPDAELSLVCEESLVVIHGKASYDDANSANRAARELLTALFDESLRRSPFRMVAWADEHFDDQHASILWPLLCDLSRLLQAPNGSALILIAGEATLRLNLHCSGEVSVRHRVDAAGLRTRMAWDSARTAVRNQRGWSAADAPLIVLFLGAGASTVEGLDTGNALRNKSLAELVNLPHIDDNNYHDAAEVLYRDLLSLPGRLSDSERAAGADHFARTLTLERLIKEEQHRENRHDTSTLRRFSRDHDTAMAALAQLESSGGFLHDPLVKILERQSRIVLVTVNFDHVVEVKAPGLTRPFVTDSELGEFGDYLDGYMADGGQVPLLKLHGDIAKPDTLVADTDQTGGGLSTARLAPLDALLARLRTCAIRPWWWIGYSMRDLDLEEVWGSAEFADLVVEHWVAPFVDESVTAFHNRWRSDRWRRRGHYTTSERVITVTASDFYKLYLQEVVAYW